ncbi:hypothetical protein KC19_3G023200 [Ceratodon purpureus]|uniref:Exonuclease 1 n=1 Tax=Ceratodon purpureus TaxID=3225 RepID=A0A8T0IHD9_CERPU|nr:hypothetical protein KC19_3G023200 [Ceratodon purpureus]
MGIQGLLPTLKSIMTPRHVRDYAGKRAAIDTYSWLHKAAFTCSKDLCLGRPNDKYIEYCMHRVNMLRHFGVQPVLVFDGGSLPMKSEQEIKRARSRKDNLERAVEHERLGNHSAAIECYQKAVDITPALAFRLIKVLRQENIEYVVAPYEADAQMAFLALNGNVDLVITEDSDLIAYGCPQIFFKMDKYGQGVGFQFSDITANKDLDFSNFSKRMILEMCIMSGCDYLRSLPGTGVKKAYGLIKRFKTYQKVLKHLKFSGVMIDQQYEEGFQRAVLTFRHHRVYDPAKSEMVHLTDVPSELDSDLDFLGPYLSQTVATAIARGEVDPTTYEPFEDMSSSGSPKADSNAEVQSGLPDMQRELFAQNDVHITNLSQWSGEASKKQFRAPRNTPDSAAFYSYASQEEMAFQVSPSSTITSQSYSSSFSKASFTSEQSPTPPSQVSPFVTEELDSGAELWRTTDLSSDCPPSSKRTPTSSEDLSSFAMDCQTKSRIVEMKAIKAFVPPFLKNGATQFTTATKLRVDSTCTTVSLKRSRSAPSKLHGTGPFIISEDHHKKNTYEGSRWSTGTDTQGSEGNELADETECSNDALNCPDIDKKQGILKDITNRGQPNAIANERNHVPHFKSDLLEERPIKSRSFSCVSHVSMSASLAQRSMNEFVSNIKPFRCSLTGCRASGLRAPLKHGARASGLRAPLRFVQLDSTSRNDTRPVRSNFSNENLKTDLS